MRYVENNIRSGLRAEIASAAWHAQLATTGVVYARIQRQIIGTKEVHVAACPAGVLPVGRLSDYSVLPQLKCRRNAGAPPGRHSQRRALNNHPDGLRQIASWNKQFSRSSEVKTCDRVLVGQAACLHGVSNGRERRSGISNGEALPCVTQSRN